MPNDRPKPPLAHRALYAAERERLAACRWLEPDASFESMGAAAQQWIDDRVDELRAALLPHADPPGALATLSARVERSSAAALEAWARSWETSEATPLAIEAALGRAFVLTEQAFAAWREVPWEVSVPLTRVPPAERSVWQGMMERHRLALAARGEQRPINPLHPAQRACTSHLRWLLAFGRDAARPSPWAPLVALFERGAWPVALGDGSLLVYVPVLRDGAVVPSPESPEEALFPPRTPHPASARNPIPRLNAIFQAGIAVPPMAPELAPRGAFAGRPLMVGARPYRPPPAGPEPPRRAPPEVTPARPAPMGPRKWRRKSRDDEWEPPDDE